ncbi:PREDICTED: uncharacterized protein LOC105150384 [Acromyrmex echinatior]|uniref:uncharacterized protein LOC105150384 n=1 Tax=Acromyrmex echinatior TaxID=103372 RepID=UPI000580CAA9|nr:PREDICTED: uncharacterized protein LOC105150384 [Acromyrmex echinatior]XP_011061710.1 PREDICTED: uncharacterized protein LOC105150384 [Acromyrmex echinatior]XP_011061712.1 PREDICTED: uncharacterized protein LOC105150384 [Acromyrmex echinatior]
MNLLRSSRATQFVVLISLIIINARSCVAESSGEYLQKAMIELQELNVPSNSLTMYDRLSSMNLGYQQGYHDYNRHRKISINNVHQGVQKTIADVPVEPAGSIIQHYAVRDSTAVTSHPKMKQPEPLAFTRAELAALYKKALEKGSAISVASLMHTLNAAGGNGNGNTPSETGHPQLPVKPMYNYYFFPLKSFASELQRDHHQAAVSESHGSVAPSVRSEIFPGAAIRCNQILRKCISMSANLIYTDIMLIHKINVAVSELVRRETYLLLRFIFSQNITNT